MKREEIKAKKIVDQHFQYVEAFSKSGQKESAKECALIDQQNTIDALSDLKDLDFIGNGLLDKIIFEQKVKEAIIKL